MRRSALGPLFVCLALAPLGCASRQSSAKLGSSMPRQSAGLSVESWVIRDRDHALAAALSDLEDTPAGIDPDSVALWRANGLRVLSLPIEQIAALRSSLPVGGPAELREIGRATTWTPIATGPDLADRVLSLDSGPFEPGKGQLRMLARSWTEPVIEPDESAQVLLIPRLRIELMPQHAEPRRIRPALQLDPRPPLTPIERGLPFDRLLLSFLGDGQHAYIIVGEAPGVEWEELALQAPDEESPVDADQPEPPLPDDRVEFPISPASLRPTLGQAMLNASSYAAGSSDLRIVVVLIPTPSPDFSLLDR